MEQTMKTKTVVTVLAAALMIAGAVFIPSLVAGQNAGAGNHGFSGVNQDGKETTGIFSVRAEAAEIRNLQAYLEVNGNIVSEQQLTVMPETAGKLVSVKTGLGETVRKGELLAEIDPSRPGSDYSLSQVYAPVSGIVTSSPVATGSTVSTNTGLFTVAAAGSLEIEAMIPEREVGQLRKGLRAEIKLEAFPGETFTAELVRLSPVLDPSSRTKKITLRFLADDLRINSGMFAKIKLNTRSYENVISIPHEAITEKRGSTVVYVINGDAINTDSINTNTNNVSVSMREVISGVSIDGETEIKSGLEAGEKVVVQGHQFLTDGAYVRVIGRI
jgi:multidrug efflux pump subunit AcrA (membrane-fusion protein)